MVRILLIAGESQSSQAALSAIASIGAQPITPTDLPAAVDALGRQPPDLVVLDLGLRPPGDPEVAAFMAACKKPPLKAPVLALLPRANLPAYRAVSSFDDFALSPCSSPELEMRLHVLLRRFKPQDDPNVLRIGKLVIDLARYEVTQDGKRMDLTFKEYELLKFLAANPGKVFTRETLLNKVWGYDYFGGTRTVDVHIRRLRSKIEDGAEPLIETVRNVGYRFRDLR